MNLGVNCPWPIKKSFTWALFKKYFNDLLSGERSLPFGLLVLLWHSLSLPFNLFKIRAAPRRNQQKGLCSIWSESSLCGNPQLSSEHTVVTDQDQLMPSLIWVMPRCWCHIVCFVMVQHTFRMVFKFSCHGHLKTWMFLLIDLFCLSLWPKGFFFLDYLVGLWVEKKIHCLKHISIHYHCLYVSNTCLLSLDHYGNSYFVILSGQSYKIISCTVSWLAFLSQ